MNVDFFHNQIIRDTVTPIFIESFNENLLPNLSLKYGNALEGVQFYEDHINDGMRIGGIFYYPLTVVVSGVARTEWICWQVSNYRLYDNFNPFSYKGQEHLTFSFADSLPEGLSDKIIGKPIYSPQSSMPVILSAMTEDKTFLAGKYSQGFIDLMSTEITDAIERELAISGLAGSGVVLEMNFAPGTYMEHISENSTYRRLRIKARACAARDLWIKWTRLDGNGTYTISDNVDRSMISFELAESVPGKIKEKEYRYLTSESVEKYQHSMGRKNITEWREMMRRVLRRGEVERFERITISKKIEREEPKAIPKEEIKEPVSAVRISTEASRERDEITERLNALLGKSDAEFSREPEILAESINSDLSELLRGALGVVDVQNDVTEEEKTQVEKSVEDEPELIAEIPEAVDEVDEVEEPEESEELEATEEVEEPEEEPEDEPQVYEEPLEEAPEEPKSVDESEIEARIRRELEEKMRAEMEELRRRNEENEQLKAKLEAQKRAEEREKALLAEAARLAVLDSEKREADRRAAEECDRLEAERKKEEELAALERARAEEAARIEAEMRAAKETEAKENAVPEEKTVYVTKTVNLIFRRGGVDKTMIGKVRNIIVATIKQLQKENVYMRIKATSPDQNTLTLNFSEVPANEEKLIIDIIQVLGKSGIGITKATLE